MRRAPVTVTSLGMCALACATVVASCAMPGGSPTSTGSSTTLRVSPTTPTAALARPLVVETVFSHVGLDPTLQDERSGLLLSRALYETLTTYDDDRSTVVPGLAEWSVSPEGKWLTLRVRAGAVFSDGSPVTSDDVIFTLNRAQGMGGSASAMLGTLGLKRVNDRTVTVTSPDSNFALPAMLANPALGVLNADVVKAHGGTIGPGDVAGAWLATHSAGSGPYVLSATTPGYSVRLTANLRWRGTPPVHSDVEVRNVPAAQQVSDLKSGSTDVALDLSPGQAQAARVPAAGTQATAPVATAPAAVTTMRSSTLAFLLLNHDPRVSPWTANPAFAEAVRKGLDLRLLADRVGGSDAAAPALGLIPVGVTGAFTPSPASSPVSSPAPSVTTSTPTGTPTSGSTSNPTNNPTSTPTPTVVPPRDLAGAKRALARSGYKGQPIPLSFAPSLPIEGVSSAAVATEIRRQLAEVGIAVSLAPAAPAAALDAYRKGRDAMGLWSWAPDYIDPENYLAFGPGGTVGTRAGWPIDSDDVVIEAATAARRAYGDDRINAYAHWQQLMNQRSPFVPLFQPTSHYAHGARVAELATNPVWTLDIAGVG